MGLKTIFQEGLKERRRRRSIHSGKNQLKDKQGHYAELLTALGRKAWENHVGIDAFGEIKAALNETKKQLDELQAQATGLGQQKKQAEDNKKQELDRLAAGQKELEESQRQVDTRLGELKNALQSAQKEMEQAKNRLGAIAVEREQLQTRAAAGAEGEAEKKENADKMAALAREAQELEARINDRDQAGKSAGKDISPLQEEAGRLQKKIEDIRSEKKSMAAEADKKISALAGELSKIDGKSKETEKTQAGNFHRLGESLAAAQSKEPGIAKEIAAVQSARAEMDGIQSLLGGLERQKDDGQVSAYKKMVAILIGAAVLAAAIVVLLFVLLSPRKAESPLRGLSGPLAASAKGLEAVAQQMQEGFDAVEGGTEETQAPRVVAASEGVLRAVLPAVGGWQLQNPHYSQGKFQRLETASLEAEYAAEDGRSVLVRVTDAGSAAAMLAPLKMVFTMNLSLDDEDATQKVTTVNGIPVAERFNKHEQEATFGIIYKDRYLIEMKTRAAKGLELLREFAAQLDLSKLRP
jgi:predicted nuclease with TOPRIM domain